jgi:hypothetical protein
MQQNSLLQPYYPLNIFRALFCPSSGAQDYTDGCGMWYIALWFTGRWSGAGLSAMCPGCGMLLEQHARNMLSGQ